MPAVTQGVGSRARLIYKEELTWGDVPAADNWLGLRYNDESVVQDINAFRSNEIRSDRMTYAVLQGNKRPGGDITTELNAEGITKLFKHALGDNVSTTGSDPYTHVIPGYHTLPVGFSLEKGFLDLTLFLVYSGGRINNMSLSVPQEGIPTVTWGTLFKTEDNDNVASLDDTPTYTTIDPFTSYQCTIYECNLAGGSLTALGIVQAFELSVANNLTEDNFVIGDQERINLLPGQRNITGNMTMVFQNMTYYDKYINATQAVLRAIFTNGTQSVQLDLPQIQYSGAAPTPRVPDAGPLKVTMPFEAERNATLGTDIQITVINSESSV